MNPQSLWLQIPEIIAIPVLCLAIITLIKAASAKNKLTENDSIDLGLDMGILATGATGSTLANDTLRDKWGLALIIYGIVMILVCVGFVAWGAYLRRWQTFPVGRWEAIGHLLIGLIPLCLVIAMLVLGYTIPVKG